MTIINVDVKGLEVVCAAYLSQDKVLYRELNEGIDLHGENQKLFGFEERVAAKIFKFKLLFGAMEYGFVNDPDMNFISKNINYWKGIIDKYYNKYKGIAAWHENIIREVSKTSQLVTPFGRVLKWDLNRYGSYKLPITEIKNYPVQSVGADVVSVARCSLHRRWKCANIEGRLVNTVHDSIVADVHSREVERTVKLLSEVFRDLPANINKIFKCNWDLETRVEISVGNNMLELTEVEI